MEVKDKEAIKKRLSADAETMLKSSTIGASELMKSVSLFDIKWTKFCDQVEEALARIGSMSKTLASFNGNNKE